MRFSVEILDHIFSFLVSHHDTLFACSMDPVLFPIIERQLFYHTVVGFAKGSIFEPECLSKIVSDNPRILNFVRILEIKIEYKQNLALQNKLDEFAETLLLFPLLKRIILTTPKQWMWNWPNVFRAALEDRLRLPTVKEVHLVGYQNLPFKLIGKCKNIENLLLEGLFEEPEEEMDSFEDSDEEEADSSEDSDEEETESFKQPKKEEMDTIELKSLTLSDISHSLCANNLHINKLLSLKCGESSVDDLPALLGVCSQTLTKLDIDLTYTQYSTSYTYDTATLDERPLKTLSPIPPNLQQLMIRAPVLVENQIEEDGIFTPKRCWSCLPAIRDIITSFIPPPKHLVLDVNLHLFDFSSNLANVDFSPLAVLGSAALSIPRIDLYVHTDILPSDVTFAHLLASLADTDDVMRAMEKGILVIHSERTAPDYVQD